MTPVSPDSMPTVPAPDWDALARFQAGESDDAERAVIARWLAEHPADARLLGTLESMGREAAPVTDGVDVEAALARVKARFDGGAAPRLGVVRGGAPRSSRPSRASSSPSRGASWVAIASLAVAASMALGIGLWRFSRSSANGGAARTIAAGAVASTTLGQRDSVMLSDGTVAVLGANTRLEIGADYGEKSRRVTVDGLAMFRVHHDPTREFVVHAATAEFRDIGTTFVVRADPTTSRATVAVTEGAVGARFAGSDKEVVVKAGERATMVASTITTGSSAGDDDVAWTRGELRYHDASLDDVRDDFARWYGVELTVADSAVAARRVTARFTDEPIDRMLDIIALAVGARVERHGNAAELKSAGGGTR